MKQLIKCCGGCIVYLLWITSALGQPNIIRVEYYFDKDPGYNLGTPVTITPGKNLSSIPININPSTLTNGVHFLGIRAKDANGAWSQDNKWLFAKPYPTDTAKGVLPNLSRVEYYLDHDPGYGNATAISFTPGNNLSNQLINVNPATLSNGVHFLGIRAKDANGSWCQDNKWLFAKPYPADTAKGILPNISRVEYYLDKDPGYGNATAVSFTPGTNLSNVTVNVDPSTLKFGFHLMGIRAKDANGSWCQDNRWLFAKPYPPDTTKPGTAPSILQVEYYIDHDPGYGKGVPVANSNSNNLSGIGVAVNISGLPTGSHKLFIRSKDANNSWSLDNVFAFTVTTAIGSPSIVVNSIVRKKLCQKDSVNVSYQVAGTYNAGNLFNVRLSDSTGNFSSAITIGSFTGTGNSIIKCAIPPALPSGSKYKVRIESTNPVVIGLTISDSLKVSKLPVPVLTPSGSLFVIKQGDSLKLGTTLSYTSYLWSNNATTSTIQARTFGSYKVIVTDVNGCSASSPSVQVDVTPTITASGPITNLCPGSTVTLNSSTASSYKWSTSAVTQSIIVTSPGTYYVIANGAGKGDTSASVVVTYKACAAPVALSVDSIKGTSAKVHWSKVSCAVSYQLQYRSKDSINFITVSPNITDTSYHLTGLVNSKKYYFQVKTICVNSPLVASNFSSLDSFTTITGTTRDTRLSITLIDEIPKVFKATLFPNPTSTGTTLIVSGNNTGVSVLITDASGKVLWQRDKSIDQYFKLPVEKLSAGTYFVTVKDEGHQETLKLVKSK